MSFIFPNPFRPSNESNLPSPAARKDFELPPFEKRDEISVLPYDLAAGELAKRALLLSGASILKDTFGVSDSREARETTTRLADKVSDIGWSTLHDIEPLSGKSAEARLDELWHERALHGDEAMLTLLSLRELATARNEGFYADRAADVLEEVQSDDTQIALK